MFLEWSANLWLVLEEIFPSSAALPPIPEHELLPPRYLVSFVSPKSSVAEKSSAVDSLPCELKQNKRITAPGHWQDVRHLILESQNSTLDYEPGDIAVLYPENSPEEVEVFLDILHWTYIADRPLQITHSLTGDPRAHAND